MKVLYVLGTQRGGSTLVGRLTASMPGFAYAGELRRLWQRLVETEVYCGCAEQHVDCPVWSIALPNVLAMRSAAEVRALQNQVAPDRGSGRSLLRLATRGLGGTGSADQRYAESLQAIYREFAAASHASVVVDCSKLPADAFVAAKSGAEVYVLHLVRDPRGVAFSMNSRAATDGQPSAADTVRAAGFWTARNLSASVVRRAVPRERFLTVKYEDVIADPTRALTRIADFVGADVTGFSVTPERVVLPTAHAPTGNGRTREQETTLREDHRWKESLSTRDRVITNALTAPLRWRFGYRSGNAERDA